MTLSILLLLSSCVEQGAQSVLISMDADGVSLSANQSSLSFSGLKTLTTSEQLVTFTNFGAKTSSTCSTTITGSSASSFSISTNSCDGTTLAASGSCSVGVTSTPIAAATYSASLNLSCGSSSKSTSLTSTGDPFVITSVTPANLATAIDSNASIVLVFNYDLDINSFNRADLKVREATNHHPIPYEYSYSSSTKTLTLTPLRHYPASKEIEIKAETSLITSSGAVALENKTITTFTPGSATLNVHGRAGTAGSPVLRGVCSRNVTSITATLNGAPQVMDDSSCTDGVWQETPTLAVNDTNYTFTLTASAADGSTSTRSVTLKKCSSLTAIVADSTYASGTGGSGDPYLITSVEELAGMAANLSAEYKLAVDLDLSCRLWVPIGTSTTAFTGKFDGDFRHIKGLAIEGPVADEQGLFAGVDGAVITKTIIYDLYINANARGRIGGLTGWASSSTIASTVTIGTIKDGSYTGGIIGYADDDVTLDSVSSVMNFTSGDGYLGGLIGYSTATAIGTRNEIYRSYAFSLIEGNSGQDVGGLMGTAIQTKTFFVESFGEIISAINNTGGIVGRCPNNNATIADAYSHSNISATANSTGGVTGNQVGGSVRRSHYSGVLTSTGNDVGGIVGFLSAASPTVTHSYAEGTISGADYVGGMLGRVQFASSVVTMNYSSAAVSYSGANGNGGFGHNILTAGQANFFLDGACGVAAPTGCPANAAIGLSSTELKKKSTFNNPTLGWVLADSSIWSIENTVDYPRHWMATCADQWDDVEEASSFSAGGSGTPADPYKISTIQELQHVQDDMAASYILVSDIDVTNDCLNLSRLSSNLSPFTGTFNGNNKKIEGFHMTATTSYYGLFGKLDGANVYDLTLKAVLERTSDSSEYTGLLVGQATNATTLTNITIEGMSFYNNSTNAINYHGIMAGHLNNLVTLNTCKVTGYIFDRDYTGTLGGSVGATVTNCIVNAYVSGRYAVSGIAAYIGSTGNLSKVTFDGRVDALNNYVGGIGAVVVGIVTKSVVTGSINSTGGSYHGGLVGGLNGGTIANSYNAASVSGIDYVGGLVGASLNAADVVDDSYSSSPVVTGSTFVEGGIGSLTGTVDDSFFLDNTCVTPINGATGAGGCPDSSGVIGITGAEMRTLSTYNNFFGWNFTTIWNITDGVTYPFLQ